VPDNFLIYADDSAVTHDCPARDGGRVEVPTFFSGSGHKTLCPYCLRTV
jgi:hypothetical protein